MVPFRPRFLITFRSAFVSVKYADVVADSVILVNCKQCGAKLVPGAAFCQSCGARVGDVYEETFSVSSDDLIKRVRELIKEGNVTRIVIKDELGKELLVIPATVGVVGAIIAPWLAAIGVIAAMATRCTLTVERKQGPTSS